MNYRIIIFLLLSIVGLQAQASDEEIVLSCPGHQHDHIEHYDPADMPIVYFDSDEMEIIIEAEGFAGYYTVEVRFMSSGDPVIHTQIDGYGDTIDVSSLTAGYYQLVITSEYNNVYIGYINIE